MGRKATINDYRRFKELWDTFDEDDQMCVLTDLIPTATLLDLIEGCKKLKHFDELRAENFDDPQLLDDLDYDLYVEELNLE